MGTLKAKVNGVWEPITSTKEEVVTGPTVPTTVPLPDLWWDTTNSRLWVQINGNWYHATEDVPDVAPDEVWVNDTEPTDPAVELWYDPDAVPVVSLIDEVWIGTQPVDPNVELWVDPSGDLTMPPPSVPTRFEFVQAIAATTWTIVHPLPFMPDVFVVSNQSEVACQTFYDNATTVTLTFTNPYAGTAYLH